MEKQAQDKRYYGLYRKNYWKNTVKKADRIIRGYWNPQSPDWYVWDPLPVLSLEKTAFFQVAVADIGPSDCAMIVVIDSEIERIV